MVYIQATNVSVMCPNCNMLMEVELDNRGNYRCVNCDHDVTRIVKRFNKQLI
jgi:transposase